MFALRTVALGLLFPFAVLVGAGCTKASGSESAESGGSGAGASGSVGDDASGGADGGDVLASGGDTSNGGAASGTGGGPNGTGGAEPQALCAEDSTWNTCQSWDFSREDIVGHADWRISTWSSENRTHSPDNLWVEDGALHLEVTGGTTPGDQTTGAEIVSTRNDYLYGSFRLIARGTAEPGTVFGWFYYLNDTSEIDIEILSEFDEDQTVHFTIHENIGPQTHQALDVGFAPSSDFHEYRFDWFEDRVVYYIDGTEIVTLTENVPFEPGSILLNHWTLSNPAWGGGPPVNDAVAQVRTIEIYTNE